MGTTGLSDFELARRCSRGDGKAWIQFIQRFSPLVYGLASRMLRDALDTDDACQECFRSLYASIHSIDMDRPLEHWIARKAYGVCLTKIRTESDAIHTGPEGEDASALFDESDEPVSLLERARGKETSLMFDYALREFEAVDRGILHMYCGLGFTVPELSEATGVAMPALRRRLARASRRLRWLFPSTSDQEPLPAAV